MTVVYDVTSTLSGTDDGGGDANFNTRNVLSPSVLGAASGKKCQLEFRFGTGCPTEALSITSVYFGQGDTTDPTVDSNFNGNQVQVKFGGSGTMGGGAAKVMVSDILTLGENWDKTKCYVAAFHVDGASGMSWSTSAIGGFAGPQTYVDNGGAGNPDTSANTIPGNNMHSHNANTVFFLEKITITDAVPLFGGSRRVDV